MNLKNKTIVGIFAHPDDEAFGPGGTLAKLSHKNNLYLLCATKGELGETNNKKRSLAEIRSQELKQSAKILGIKQVFFLGFKDGSLCNSLYQKLAEKIQKKLDIIKPQVVITYEPRGISGHLDHIAVSLTTSFVVNKLSYVEKLLYYCIDEKRRPLNQNYFIYFPPGYKKSEIDLTIDVSPFWKKKMEAIKSHQSQIKDVKKLTTIFNKMPKKEHFIFSRDLS